MKIAQLGLPDAPRASFHAAVPALLRAQALGLSRPIGAPACSVSITRSKPLERESSGIKPGPAPIYWASTATTTQPGDTTMLKLGKTAMIAPIALSVLGTAAMAGAKDDDGGAGAGGFVISGSTDGVNPAYHQDLFGNSKALASHAQAKAARRQAPSYSDY